MAELHSGEAEAIALALESKADWLLIDEKESRAMAHGTSVGVSEAEFPLMVAMLAGAPLTPGHRVEVLLNNDGTYARMWEDLRSAQRSITLRLYYGVPGRMARTIGDILRERLTAGVRVYILYDAFGTVDIPASELRRSGRLGRTSSRSARFASPDFTWRRTARTCAASSSMAALDGPAGLVLTISGTGSSCAGSTSAGTTCGTRGPASSASLFDNGGQIY
jgi:hypothetical protein